MPQAARGPHDDRFGGLGNIMIGRTTLDHELLRLAREAALQHGISNIEFRVMDAESTEFTAESFDMVFGVAILHHLDQRSRRHRLSRLSHGDSESAAPRRVHERRPRRA